MVECRYDLFIFDRPAADADPLGKLMNVGTGCQSSLLPGLHRECIKRFAARALSIGPRDQDNGASGVLNI